MSSVIIDANILTLLMVGMINPRNICKHKRTSIYNEDDYKMLLHMISEYDQIYTCPNIITEVDNLLNNMTGEYHEKYITNIKNLIEESQEKYMESKSIIKDWHFDAVGLTDSIILLIAKTTDLLISGDSELCDYAKSLNIKTFDFKEYVNIRILEDA